MCAWSLSLKANMSLLFQMLIEEGHRELTAYLLYLLIGLFFQNLHNLDKGKEIQSQNLSACSLEHLFSSPL